MELNEKIKYLRAKRNLTLDDVAKSVGVSTPTVQRWESGEIKNLRRDKIYNLAKALHTSPAYLMGWEDEPISQHDIDNMVYLFSEYGVSIQYEEDSSNGEQYTVVYYDGNNYGEVVDDLVRLYDDIKDRHTSEIQKRLDLFFSSRRSYGALRISNLVEIPKKKYPLIGSIAAGTPILAEDSIEDYITIDEIVDADFCLRVRGDSMIDANIHSGDIVFIKAQDYVTDGKIHAILKEDPDTYDTVATLKKVYKQNGGYLLIPANPDTERYRPEFWNGEKDRIVGRVVFCLTKID